MVRMTRVFKTIGDEGSNFTLRKGGNRKGNIGENLENCVAAVAVTVVVIP